MTTCVVSWGCSANNNGKQYYQFDYCKNSITSSLLKKLNCLTGRFKSVLECEVPEPEENDRDVEDHPKEQKEVLLTGQPSDFGDIAVDLSGEALFLRSSKAFHMEMPYFIEELRFKLVGDSFTATFLGDVMLSPTSDFRGDFSFFTNVVSREGDFTRFSSRLSIIETGLRGLSIMEFGSIR